MPEIKAVMDKIGTGPSSLTVWTRNGTTSSGQSQESGSCTIADYPFYRSGSRYQLQTSPASWDAAVLDCQSNGARLVELATAEEKQFVINQVLSTLNGGTTAFIGLKKISDGWVWHTSGDAFNGVWATGYPGVDTHGTLEKNAGIQSAASFLPNAYICECQV